MSKSKQWSDALDKKAKAMGLRIEVMGERWTADTINDEFFEQLAADAYKREEALAHLIVREYEDESYGD